MGSEGGFGHPIAEDKGEYANMGVRTEKVRGVVAANLIFHSRLSTIAH